MTRFWTCHWQSRYWKDAHNRGGDRIRAAGSNRFRARGVHAGDTVYIVSISGRRLFLGGKMVVDDIVSRAEAIRRTGNSRLFENEEWIVGGAANGTPLDLKRRLAPDTARRLRFVSPKGPPKALFFINDDDLDVQATRGIRELTAGSAAILDEIIRKTDARPHERIITV